MNNGQGQHDENVKVPWPSDVPASSILYSDSLRNLGGGLHRSHIFNRAPPTETGAIRIMKVHISSAVSV